MENGRVCTSCGNWKPSSEFHKQRLGLNGLKSECKACRSNQSHAEHCKKTGIVRPIRKVTPYGEVERKLEIERKTGLKVCSKCGLPKRLGEFHKNRYSKDGRQSRCSECENLYYATNKEKVRESHREYLARPETKPKMKKWAKRFNALRKSRLKQGGKQFTDQEWIELVGHFDHRCINPDCWKQLPLEELTSDHVVPIILGGNNSIANTQPLCLSCNSSKGKRIIDYRPSAEMRLYGNKETSNAS